MRIVALLFALMLIGCTGESTQSIDKMRRCLGGYVKSICNTRSGRGSNGSGSEQPVLWHMMTSP
jgi:hypothetical protein